MTVLLVRLHVSSKHTNGQLCIAIYISWREKGEESGERETHKHTHTHSKRIGAEADFKYKHMSYRRLCHIDG